MWASGHNGDIRRAAHGYEATREQAMAAFKRSWHREGRIMPTSFINDPEHWLDRAKEARTLGDQMNDEGAKQAMLRIAADYERLAERAAERARGGKQ